MAKKKILLLGAVSAIVLVAGFSIRAQESQPDIHVIVDMVQLNVAVTDDKGNYITGLRPEDFAISEDGVTQKIATFAEGDEPTRSVAEVEPNASKARKYASCARSSVFAGAHCASAARISS